MIWPHGLVVGLWLLAAVISGGVAAVAWRRRAAPGGSALVWLMLAIAWWTLFRGVEVAAAGPGAKVVWAKLQYFGIVSVAPLWLRFALAYARPADAPAWRVLRPLWMIPAITAGLALTNEYHALIWRTIVPVPGAPWLQRYTPGAWFWVNVAYSYALLAAGSLALVSGLVRVPGRGRQRAVLLLVGAALPWAGNALHVTGLSPVQGLDLTPFMLTGTGALLLWSLVRFELLDVLPAAGGSLVENLADGVIVVDAAGRVTELNPAAAAQLGLEGRAVIGQRAEDVLGPWPELLAALREPAGAAGSLEIGFGRRQYLDYRLSSVGPPGPAGAGWLIALRDVTEQRRAETELRLSQARFRALFEHGPDASLLVSLEGRLVDGNRAAEALLGGERARWVGRTLEEVGLVRGAEWLRAAARLQRHAKGLPAAPEEFTLARADGGEVRVEVSTTLVRIAGQPMVLGVARDVGTRREAEEALRQSEERYRDLVENVEEFICTHDLEGTLLSVNRAALSKMGYTAPEELVGRSLAEFLSTDARARFPAYLDAIRATGRASGLMRVVTRSGQERTLEFENTLGRDGRGQPMVRGVARDVTERRVAEREIRLLNEQLEQRVRERTAELRRSQRDLEHLARLAPVGIYRTDPSGCITYVNDRWCEIIGIPADRALGCPLSETGIPGSHERGTGSPGTTADPHVTLHAEGRVRTPAGSDVWIMNQLTPELGEGGQVVGAVGTLTDISQLKAAEEEQQKLASLVEHSPDFIGVADLDGRLVYVNAAGCRLLGLERPEQARGRALLDLVLPAERVPLRRSVRSTLLHAETWDGETRLVRAGSGAPIEVAARGFLIRDGARGAPRFVAFVARDITERRQAEAALRATEARLQQAMKMEVMGRLAGGVAHDFNNLLTIILGETELLAQSRALDSPEGRRLDSIREAAESAAGLTKQLLAFSRRQVLQPKILDPNEVIAGTGRLLQRVIGEDVTLRTVPAPEVGRISGDRGQLEQVLLNLAVNARDAMPRGGQLTVETANVELDEHALRGHPGAVPGGYVMFAVSDTGSGMTEEVQAHIFEPFFTTKESDKGTGLGLATVYGIVNQHGGYIAVESAPGKGATFRIYLPRVAPEARPEAAGPALPRAAGGRETVLVVEDEAQVGALVRHVLEGLGYTVHLAASAAAAIELFDHGQARVDLLLTDVVMPQMSGSDLAEQLRRRQPTLPVLFMSGHAEDAVVRYGLRDRSLLLLRKPFSRLELGRAVRAALDGARSGAPSAG